MSRDVEGEDDKDDKELRTRLGRSDGEKLVDLVLEVVLLVVIVMEEEPLRSDTRLPLESSPYMAGIFLQRSNWQLGQMFSSFSTQSPAINNILPQTIDM